MYTEDDLISLSALQHFVFCPRQCALIHVEQMWSENAYTAEGRLMHEKRVHGKGSELRDGVRTVFGMHIRSLLLGVAGIADAVEFHPNGSVFPVEYKRGRPKEKNMDEIQLCAQAICLEEMLHISIPEGALFYGKKKRRKQVSFDNILRGMTEKAASDTIAMLAAGKTPPPVMSTKCGKCSLHDDCKPELFSKRLDVNRYLRKMLVDEKEDA